MSDDEITVELFKRDPFFCEIPTDEQIGIEIRKIEPTLSDEAVVRITERVKLDLQPTDVTPKANYVLPDKEIITEFFRRDLFCQIPTDEQIGIEIKKIEPKLSDEAVIRIRERLKPELRIKIQIEQGLADRDLARDF